MSAVDRAVAALRMVADKTRLKVGERQLWDYRHITLTSVEVHQVRDAIAPFGWVEKAETATIPPKSVCVDPFADEMGKEAAQREADWRADERVCNGGEFRTPDPERL